MNRAQPLPASLRGRAFHIAEAHGEGVARSRLRAADLVIPTRGVRAPRAVRTVPDAEYRTPSERMRQLKADLLRRAQEFGPALTDDQFYSGSTGLLLLESPIPYTRTGQLQLHVSARRPAGMPRRTGIVGHRLVSRPPARWVANGLPIEHPARMWRQVAREWSIDDLIVAADHLVLPRRRLIALDDLRAEIAASAYGSAPLLRAIAEVRPGAESPEETRLRLVLTRAGLPRPEVNWGLRDLGGRFIARLDLAWPRYRVGGEDDGRVHAFDDDQFARDADRWDEIRHTDWELVRVLSHHLRPDPQVAVDMVGRALFDAGWRPGRD
ncbi:hypothetical protein [Microbacterium tumbae]